MSGLVINAVVLIAVAVAVLMTALPAIAGLRRRELGEAAAAARRRSALASTVAAVAGVGAFAGWLALGPDNVTRSLPVLPLLVGIAMTVVAIAAEKTWPRPSGTVRVASLRTPPKTRADGGRVALGGAGISLAVLAVGSLTDSTDGRMGQLAWGSGGTGAGPYPGSFYAIPLISVGVVLAALTWWGLREVESRPALGPDLEDVDAAAREASRIRVLRGATFASLVTAGALLTTFSLAWSKMLGSAGDFAPNAQFDGVGWSGARWGFIVLIFVGIAIALIGLKALVTPGPPMPPRVESVPPSRATGASA